MMEEYILLASGTVKRIICGNTVNSLDSIFIHHPLFLVLLFSKQFEVLFFIFLNRDLELIWKPVPFHLYKNAREDFSALSLVKEPK